VRVHASARAGNEKNKQQGQSGRKNCEIVVETMENPQTPAGNALQYQ
jgi:hypothetical protein